MWSSAWCSGKLQEAAFCRVFSTRSWLSCHCAVCRFSHQPASPPHRHSIWCLLLSTSLHTGRGLLQSMCLGVLAEVEALPAVLGLGP